MLNSVNEYMLIYIYVHICIYMRYEYIYMNVCKCEWLYNVYVFIYEDINTAHIYRCANDRIWDINIYMTVCICICIHSQVTLIVNVARHRRRCVRPALRPSS